MTRSAEEERSAFEKLLGRAPSDFEMARLVRVRDAMGIRENDALWMVLLVLETYDAEFRRYPALLAAESDQAMERFRQEARNLAISESKRAHRTLADAVATTSLKVASDKVRVAFWLMMGWALVASAALAGLCMAAGYVLGSGKAPFWLGERSASEAPALLFAHLVLGAPAGWLVLVGLGVAVPVYWFRRLDGKPPLWQVIGLVGLLVVALLILISLFA
jgi:hypothetical protein